MVMTRGRYAPYPRQAEQTGKAFPDLAAIQQRRANASDGDKAGKCYPGADQDNNLWILAGEILLCPRNNRSGIVVGLTSMAGVETTAFGGSADALMRNYYVGGVPFEDIQIGGDNLFGTDPLEHGFGLTMAGACTVTNYDAEDHPPGTKLAWCIPDFKGNTQSSKSTGRQLTVDNGFSSVAASQRSRYPEGTQRGKPVVELRVFKEYDATLQLQAMSWALNKTKAEGGVKDMTLADLDRADKPYSTLQEQATALRESMRALTAAIAAWLDGNVVNKTGEKALFDELASGDKIESLILFLMQRNQIDQAKWPRGPWDNDYKVALDRAFGLLFGTVAGALYTRMSRICATSVSGAKGGLGKDEYVLFHP